MGPARHLNLLLTRWHETAARFRTRVAVVEVHTQGRWTFGELEAAGKEAAHRLAGVVQQNPTIGRLSFPRGFGAGFIIEVLGAWEAGMLVCPVDDGVAICDDAPWPRLADDYPSAVLVKTTSGSSGRPRHVLFSPEALAADADAIVSTMGLRPDLPNLAAISLAHSYGFSNLVLPLLIHGIPVVMAGSQLPEAVRSALAFVARGEVGSPQAVLPGVPALWRTWFNAGVLEMSRLALAVSAGAPLPLDLENQVWTATRVKIHNFLGSSECGGIAFDRTSEPRAEESLAGTALDGVALSLDDEQRLVVRSRAVGLTYWPPGEDELPADAAALQPGVFRTQDIAELRDDGSWHLLGRATDTINLAGRKVHPLEIESLLKSHPDVRECLVFGVPSTDPARGEEVVAAIALEDRAATAWEELPAWLAGRLPAWKQPRHWWPRADLCPTHRGKIPRARWRDVFLQSGRSGRRQRRG